ncbi:MAG TPA: NHL repeat-containing protein [Gammaproteobacteria bacterium]|nr:NHL repeat-containing protein [Gammaproteobacteria bacterium]
MLVVSASAASPVLAQQQVFEPVAVSDGVLSRPNDLILSADGRDLPVTDLGHHIVRVMDADTLAVVGEIGSGELSPPHDAAMDDRGRLMVADTGNDRIAMFEIREVGGRLVVELSNGLGRPERVAQGRDGRVYVTSVAGGHITVFSNGRRVARAGGPGSGPSQYSRPHDKEVDDKGWVIVADPGNNRLQVLSADLEFQFSIGGAPPHDFNGPKYFALDDEGRLYVGDQHNHRLLVFDRNPALLAQMGTGSAGDSMNPLNGLERVVVRGMDVWIADTYNNRVVRYRRKDGGSS